MEGHLTIFCVDRTAVECHDYVQIVYCSGAHLSEQFHYSTHLRYGNSSCGVSSSGFVSCSKCPALYQIAQLDFFMESWNISDTKNKYLLRFTKISIAV